METNQPITTQKKSPLKWIILVIILGIGAGAAAVYGFGISNSPKALYLRAEYNTYKQFQEDLDEYYGDELAFQERVMDEPSRTITELSGNFDVQGSYLPQEIGLVQSILEQLTINMTSEQDPTKSESFVNVGLEMGGANLLDMNVVQTKDKLGLQVPVLYDQMLYVEAENFGEAMRQIDPYYEGPEQLNFESYSYKDFQLTDKEKEHLKENYGLFLVSQLTDEQFTLEKGVSYEFNGVEQKLDKLTISWTPEETMTVINQLIDKLIEDAELQTMIADRVTKFASNPALAGELGVDDLSSPENVKRLFVEDLNGLKSDMEDLEFPNGLQSVVYINNDKQIVDRELATTIADKQDNGVKFVVSTKNVPLESKQVAQGFKVEMGSLDEEAIIEFDVVNVITKGKERNDALTATLYVEEYGRVENDLKFEMNSTTNTNSENREVVTHDFNLLFDGQMVDAGLSAISGTITEEKEINLNDDFGIYNYDIELNLGNEAEGANINFVMDTKTEFTDGINVADKLNDAVNVAEMTEAEMMQLQQQVSLSAQQLIMSNMNLFMQ
ncbi:DUF6583 family protein [Bacillus solimangrovi]|uniref:Uncharacterized protein n=1 Tax=Bacillus solimangrovi TaxID=1305675 RepID=A0A1E5LBA2_9BACI|nr:DUF6583 family protein [Bacillus solimangrovi]OEH91365.1 hypothetical protein BFG57_05735 [Bacillus solimangrovi]